ncbi:TonB-dependent receptor [Exilibacterium tricleocarpae]|uniref:TonB-dependent receptor n=1 Tax=Exilibacterium tricleocarpae TaxID=2591008 RepID=A0A545ST19_9GAMM|nr:TonB-dependent receptor [Exilibacterium tricleocarpae]TQV68113.1 TonB-dependent receptor [Exilibacterium tricleocarpae]
MSQTPPFRRSLITTALLLSSASVAGIAMADSTLRGYITDASGAPLAGARVTVAGTPQSGFTDHTGRFTIRNVDGTDVELSVTYVGYEEKRKRIDPTSDNAENLLIILGRQGQQMEEVLVVSQRIAMNDALNRYRAADGISKFVSADDIGQFVDQNVAENLQRLPGISITRDQGEGRFVSVRGVGAGLSNVTINGMRIGTPEDGSRAVPLDIIPSGSVDLLEINKVPTPDMPGDAVGGTVDVRSGSPFARRGDDSFNFDYRAELSYNELGEETNPAGGLNFSNVFSIAGGLDNLGVAVGANYQRREFESDNLETEYDYVEVGGVERLAPIEVQQRKYFVDRERLGANLNLEYRPDDDNRYFVDALFSRFTDEEVRQRSIFVLEDGELVSFDGSRGRYEGIAEDGFRRRIRNRTKEQDTFAISFRGEHLRNDWTFDYQVGHSITRESVPDEYEGRFEKTGDPLDADFVMGNGKLTTTFFNAGVPDTSHRMNTGYVLDRVVVEPIEVDDDDTNFSFNAERANAFGNANLTLKAGVDARMKKKDSDVDEFELRDVPDLGLEQFTSNSPGYGLGDLGPGISASRFLDFFFSNRDQFRERPQDVDENRQLRLGQDFVADENVYAGYVMATLDLGLWRVITGVRIEHTDYSADGNQIEVDADGNVAVARRSVGNDYNNVLPALHIRYEPREDVVARAAYTKTVSRPSFSDISPRFEIDRDDFDIETGNPDLDPFESDNFDLLLDWYPGNNALVSLGIFYKDVDNFSADFTTPGEGPFQDFQVTRPMNFGNAEILGLEANVELGMELLNPALSGFLIGANATFLDTEFDFAERPGETFRLPGAVHRNANLYLGYESGPLSLRISYSERGKYLEDIGADPNFDIWVADSTQLDVVASYRLTEAFNLRLEASNLTDDPLELYQGSKGNTFQFEEYGLTYSVGLTGRF